MIKAIWIILGSIFVILGTIGLFLPVVPTVPFLLLAAYFYARSSSKLYNWLLNNKTFGPMIRDWQEHGAISRKTKILTTISLLAAVIIQVIVKVPNWVLIVECVIFVLVLGFVWTRPEE